MSHRRWSWRKHQAPGAQRPHRVKAGEVFVKLCSTVIGGIPTALQKPQRPVQKLQSISLGNPRPGYQAPGDEHNRKSPLFAQGPQEGHQEVGRTRRSDPQPLASHSLGGNGRFDLLLQPRVGNTKRCLFRNYYCPGSC